MGAASVGPVYYAAWRRRECLTHAQAGAILRHSARASAAWESGFRPVPALVAAVITTPGIIPLLARNAREVQKINR
jgi:hypothetical protein